MLTDRLSQAVFLLASWTLAAGAHARYGQMRLDGIEIFLAFALAVVYGLIVDLALFFRIFQYRAALVVGFIVARGVTFFLLGRTAPPGKQAGLFKVYPQRIERLCRVHE